jgi:hypothetical protein
MRKIITGFNAMPGQSRSALHGWALQELGASIAPRRGVRRLTLNLVGDPPAFVPRPPANAEAPAAYDVVMMMWLDDDAAIFSEPSLAAHAARVHSYVVDEIPEKLEIPLAQGRVTPGMQFGLFPKPEDRREFLDDIGGWVKASTAQYAVEHVLKW